MDSFIQNYEIADFKAKLISNPSDINDSVNEDISQLKLLHRNIRSLQKHFDDVVCLISQINFNFDVIILTETHRLYSLEHFNLNGYDIIYNEGNFNSHDGVIMYVNKNLNYSVRYLDLGVSKAVELKITNLSGSTAVTAAYRSPSSCPKQFNLHLLEYLSSVKFKNHIITGDININLLGNEDFIEEYKTLLSSFDFVSYINEATRRVTGTCLDHFFVKNDTSVEKVDSFIILDDSTDHDPVALIIDYQHRVTKQHTPMIKKYLDYKKLRNSLNNVDWEILYQINDIDEMVETFLNTLTYHINNSTKSVKFKSKQKAKKPWITRALLTSISIKNNLYKELQKDPHNEVLKSEYKVYKNGLNRLIQKSKKEFFKKIINNNKISSKNLWNCVNEICGKTQTETKITQINTDEGNLITNKQAIANEFNRFYSTLGQKLANKIVTPTEYHDSTTRVEQSMFLFHTTPSEIVQVIGTLKTKKAPGRDGIRAETLKEVADLISIPLARMINRCFDYGYFPKSFKIGLLKPLYKSGNELDPSNYRPITLISTLCKILEKTIKIRMLKFLNKHNIISERQFGFKEGKSTEDAICSLTTLIYDAIDKKIPALSIFVDLSKAFDTVCHSILLEKLEKYGLRGQIHDLLKSYLSGRQQQVSINETFSDLRVVTYGVPQGTVLGPLLFSIYVNSLLNLKLKGTVISFADDTAIFYKSDSWGSLKEMAESDFRVINEWFKYNRLTLNTQKTNYLLFTSYSSGLHELGNLIIDEKTEIPEAEKVKYLGIIIDRHLRWELQANNIIKKLRGLIGRFRFLSDFLDISHLKIIYYSLVQSQLSYGIMGWGGVYDCYLKKIEVVQKWILRIMYRKNITYPSNDLYRLSGVLDVRQLFCQKIFIHIYKNNEILERINHSYFTRNRENAQIPKREKTIGQRCYTYLRAKLYNILPTDVRNSNNLKSFKIKLKFWLKETNRMMFHQIINNIT